VKITET